VRLVILMVGAIQCVWGNPFAIEFGAKSGLTNEDFMEVQRQVEALVITPLVQAKYEDNPNQVVLSHFEDFNGRCTKGKRQILIDPDKGFYPIKKLVKIGKGGDRCVVCCAPFNGKYPYYVSTMIKGLREVKFDGHFLYYIGGWPNPTGQEIKYAGVPYSFKIFAMVEAAQLGFNNVLWVDSACYPLRSLDPLFEHIEQYGALINWYVNKKLPTYIFPSTRALLEELTGVDVLNAKFVNTITFGLKMDTSEAIELVRQYYACADMGTPFLSCFPEEWVLTSIINQKQFSGWRVPEILDRLIDRSLKNVDDTPHQFEMAKERKGFFYQRKGR
jgi:hypothetical protein